MSRLLDSWDKYWFRPAPLVDLAMVRIIAVATELSILLLKDGGIARQELYASLPREIYEPIPMLLVFIWPFGFDYRPPLEVLQAVWWIAIAAGAFALVGLRTNLALGVFAAACVFLKAHEWSYGSIHHTAAVMMIALGALTISPSGRVLSLDALWSRGSRPALPPSYERTSTFARWPLLLLAWFFVAMYLSAAASKIINTDFAWANGYSLQYFLIMDGMRWNSPLALWLSQFHVLIVVAQWLVMLFQLTFVLAVVFPVLRWIYVPAGLALHVGIYMTLTAPFFEWIALYAIFVPWSFVFAYIAGRGRRKGRTMAGDAPPEPA